MRSFPLIFALVLSAGLAHAAPPTERMARGEKIYTEKCLMCHQVTGLGAPPVYPPLAGSEWVTGDRTRLIKVLCEGLSGPITVKGATYRNAMPAQILDDEQVADVLTYVSNTWENRAEPFTAEEVAQARAKSRFKTFDALVKAGVFQPLPTAPAGWTLREITPLPEFFTRMATAGANGPVYLLSQKGGIYRLDLASYALTKILEGDDYLETKRGDCVTMGLAVDAEERLWITSNQKLVKNMPQVTNEVVIWRTGSLRGGQVSKPEAWFRHQYPHGVGGFNHGVSHLAFGPDGMLYVNSGSRTDGGEIRGGPEYTQIHEVETTACLWRFDPKAASPQMEVFASGIRNAYGFAWDAQGHLFTFSNGPDYDAGEEMDFIEPHRHYGFPFQYEDWPAKAQYPYPYTPPAPAGVTFTHPVENIGPDGGFRDGKVARTFTPHSCPGGTVWCGDQFPEPLRNSFLMPRFGNLLAKPEDSGFDVLSVRPRRRADGTWEAEVHTVLAPLGRPLDVVALAGGKALILEYTRPTNFKDGLGWLPGRILELAPVAK